MPPPLPPARTAVCGPPPRLGRRRDHRLPAHRCDARLRLWPDEDRRRGARDRVCGEAQGRRAGEDAGGHDRAGWVRGGGGGGGGAGVSPRGKGEAAGESSIDAGAQAQSSLLHLCVCYALPSVLPLPPPQGASLRMHFSRSAAHLTAHPPPCRAEPRGGQAAVVHRVHGHLRLQEEPHARPA